VFERLAVDVLKSVVSVFESFARQQFRERVSNAEELTSDSGNVFQRLDHTAALFSEHAGVDLIAIAGQGRWQDLRSRSRPARAHPRRRDRRWALPYTGPEQLAEGQPAAGDPPR
jgi:hypothetical protein